LEDPPSPADGFQAVEDFDSLLTLHAGNDGADRGGCRRFAVFHLRAREQIAGATRLQKLPIIFGHRAFIAGAVRRWDKDARHALNLLDGAVDPRAVDAPAVAIYGKTGLAVVQPANHQIGPAEYARAKIVHDVTI